MSTRPLEDDFCHGCHREALHVDGKPSEGTPSNSDQVQGTCLDSELRASVGHCEVDEACCNVDDCPLECASVCDGFVDCDASTVCSVAHCEDQNCEDTGPVCFDQHCCNGADGEDCEFESLMGFDVPTLPDNFDSLSCTTASHAVSHPAKMAQHSMHGMVDPCYQNDFLLSYQAHTSQCNNEVSTHFDCYDFQKDLHGKFAKSAFPVQTEVNPADIFHMLGMCSDLSACHGQDVSDQDNCAAEKLEDSATLNMPNCFYPENSHAHANIKTSNDFNRQALTKGPHRNRHNCCIQTLQSHPYSPYSRHSRSSVRSHLLSSPGETPPPLDVSSALTSPGFSTENNDLHTCKWTANVHGTRIVCGATFAYSGALQHHLISSHMKTINGAQGVGYYCCWEGCHRPDEPFSQKSKLQGHFLTHSNYKNFQCSVCGKIFARQATLIRHERSHRGDKPYKCEECGKSFTDSSELKTHSRTHTGEKPFRCTYPGCNFQTGDSSNMSSHRLTHGERKHKCHFPGCSKSFTRPDQLKRHLRAMHKQEPSSTSSTLRSPTPEQFTIPTFAVAQ